MLLKDAPRVRDRPVGGRKEETLADFEAPAADADGYGWLPYAGLALDAK